MAKRRVLCVCRGNYDRSPLIMGLTAAKLFELGIDATVDSCGIIDDIKSGNWFATASKNSIAVLDARGIDISAHRPRHASDFDLRSYDLIIAVTEEVKQYLVEHGADPKRIRIVNEGAGGLKDPHGQAIDAYERCLATVERELPHLLDIKV